MSPYRSALLRNRHLWIAGALFVIAVLPVAVLTLVLGDLNIGQSIGDNPRGDQLPRLHPDNLLYYLDRLTNEQASWVLVASALTGFAVAMRNPDRRLFFWVLLFLSTYVFFTALNDPHVSRYTIFWLPAVTVFAALPLRHLTSDRARVWYGAWLASIVVLQVVGAVRLEPQRSAGFQEAARVAVASTSSPAIFVDAYNNGYFTFFVRALDPDRSNYVIRGDKILSSSAVDTTTWAKQHVDGTEELLETLQRLGIGVLVLEEKNYTEFPVHDLLRDVVKGAEFELIAEIPIDSTLPRYADQSLLVYRFLGKETSASPAGFYVPLPIIGKKLYVPKDGSAPTMMEYSAD